MDAQQYWKNHGVSVKVKGTFLTLVCDDSSNDKLSKSASGWISSCPDQDAERKRTSDMASDTSETCWPGLNEEQGVAKQWEPVVEQKPCVEVRVINTFIVVAPCAYDEDSESSFAARRRVVRSCPNLEYEEPEPEESPVQKPAVLQRPTQQQPFISLPSASESMSISEDADSLRELEEWACSTPTSDNFVHESPACPRTDQLSHMQPQRSPISSRQLSLLHRLLDDQTPLNDEAEPSRVASFAAYEAQVDASSLDMIGLSLQKFRTKSISGCHLSDESDGDMSRSSVTMGGSHANPFQRRQQNGVMSFHIPAVEAAGEQSVLQEPEDECQTAALLEGSNHTSSHLQCLDEPSLTSAPSTFVEALQRSLALKRQQRDHVQDIEQREQESNASRKATWPSMLPEKTHDSQEGVRVQGAQQASALGEPSSWRASGSTPASSCLQPPHVPSPTAEPATFLEALQRGLDFKRRERLQAQDVEQPTPAQEAERLPSSRKTPPPQAQSSGSSSRRRGGRRGRGALEKNRLMCQIFLNPNMLVEGFDLVKKIIGKGGCNTRDIHEATGAKVRVRGSGSEHMERGTGREASVPLMIALSGEDCCSKDFQVAFEMTCSLLEDVARRFETYNRQRRMRKASDHPQGLRFWIGDASDDAKACLGVLGNRLLWDTVKSASA